MHFPRIIAAQRLQTWLLVTALVAVLLTGLLAADLARNLRSVVISETNKTLTNAVAELCSLRGLGGVVERLPFRRMWTESYAGCRMRCCAPIRISKEVSSGMTRLWDTAFQLTPSRKALFASLHLNVKRFWRLWQKAGAAGVSPTASCRMAKIWFLWRSPQTRQTSLSAWSLRRIFNFSDSSELNKRLLLVIVVGISLMAIGAVLRLSFSLQRGFGVIQAGLERLRTDVHYRLPDQNHELRTIVRAINTMAESRQRLEADLRREDRLRVMGRVVAGIAHEIRNPLNSIRLSTRLLAKRFHGQAAASETITLITSEIDRLDALLKSLLVFGADEPEKLRRQPVQPVLERTLALVKPHAEEHGVKIQVTAPGECEALIDGNYLQQALMNLLLNAIDASGQNGEVGLSLSSADGQVEIRVEDSGPGLTSEQQERLFEAFYTTKPSGTGLGLAVTKTLLEKMGATIESDKGVRGARFRVLLPAGGVA